MVMAEMLKITRGMDSNVKVMDTNLKVLIDGAQTRFSSHAGPDGLCRQMVQRQEASCNRRSVCHF
jgi:hypothetical protein